MLAYLMKDDPVVPPDQEPPPPVEEPPDRPVTEPDAPVREPAPDREKRLACSQVQS